MNFRGLTSRQAAFIGASFGLGLVVGAFGGGLYFKKKAEKEITAILDSVNEEKEEKTDISKEFDEDEDVSNFSEWKKTAGVEEVNGEISYHTRFKSEKDEELEKEWDELKKIAENYLTDPAEMESPGEESEENSAKGGEKDGMSDISEEFLETEPVLTRNESAGMTLTEEMRGGKAPKIISYESFCNDYPQFDKETLYFYTEDNVLATEEEEEVEDISRVVGDALEKYGFSSNDERTIHVRNMSFGTDYEIIKVWGSFRDVAY